MDKQRVMVILYLVAFFATFQICFSFPKQLQKQEHFANQVGSTVILPVSGNVYPKGSYHATLHIGNSPRPYSLDIDTGSDVTWLQCDAPCSEYFPAPHPLYKPSEDIVKCDDPYCALFHWPNKVPCQSPEEQCDYEVKYADHGSSLGVLIRDLFPLKLTNGNSVLPRLAFGILEFRYIEWRMELFESAKTIRLRTVEDKFLVANDDEETVSQHRNDSSRSSVWNVETITGRKYVRFKSCYGTYLTASDNLFPGMIGKKVVQSVPKSVDMSTTDWEPVRDGFQVRLRTRTGSFLRPNGGVPPWRNTVTHGMPQTSKTREKVLWSIDVVEALPAPHRRSRSADNKSASGCSDDRMSAPKASQRLTTTEDL